MRKKVFIWGIGIMAFAIIAFAVFAINSASSYEAIDNFEGDIKIYKSQNCGCCGIYSNYFQRKGNSNTKIVNLENMRGIKNQYHIPKQLESCHTTIIGDYFVEGHIPLEAIEKLLQEKPDIAGIAMAGMPDGSPGMPGTKRGDFVIYAVNHDGTYEEFMRI